MSKALFILIASIMMFALLAGCSQAPAVTPTTQAADTAQPSGYPAPSAVQATPEGYPAPAEAILQVMANGKQSQPFAAADLGPLAKVTVENENGPKLGDVLQLAGIQDFASIIAVGSNGSLELSKAQVTAQVILSIANNTFILVVPGTPKGQWIRDITTITVK